MIAEIALGLVSLALVFVLYKQGVDGREERRVLLNRSEARNISELAVLQAVTKPTRGEMVQAVKNGHAEPVESEPRRPSLPFGL